MNKFCITEILCLPTRSHDFDHVVSVVVDDKEAKTHVINTKGRGEVWKENVLRNFG